MRFLWIYHWCSQIWFLSLKTCASSTTMVEALQILCHFLGLILLKICRTNSRSSCPMTQSFLLILRHWTSLQIPTLLQSRRHSRKIVETARILNLLNWNIFYHHKVSHQFRRKWWVIIAAYTTHLFWSSLLWQKKEKFQKRLAVLKGCCPICVACLFGQAYKRPWRSKSKQKHPICKLTDDASGKKASLD